MQIGMSFEEAMTIPYSLLQDLIAIDQIQNGVATRVLRGDDAEDELMQLLKVR